MLVDDYGRVMKTLRISMTDRCNLRCLYCMPARGASFLPPSRLLGKDELLRILRLLSGLGIERFKFTGGEPLLNPDLEEAISAVGSLPGAKEISLTTNGVHLKRRAASLAKAGLGRVTVSVDSLDEGSFSRMTRGGALKPVLEGIAEAESQGLGPIKINTVVLNQDLEELLDLAALSLRHPWDIRFIEYMPVSGALAEGPAAGPDPAVLRRELERKYGALDPAGGDDPAAPAVAYRLPGAKGRVGFISSVSQPFCARCDRLRLQADGFLRLCMARPDGLDLAAALRRGRGDAELEQDIRLAVRGKPSGHAFYREAASQDSLMWRIGG